MIGKITPQTAKIGWIGTGVMGAAMCSHLLMAGYSVTVHTRTRARAKALFEMGADWAESPAAVARCSDLVITMVGFPKDVRAVFLGPDGLLAHLRQGSVVVDMTTSEPTLAREIYFQASAVDIASLDAPVSGGDVGAKDASLSIMVGGNTEVFKLVHPVFALMGTTIIHQGAVGNGQHAKLVNQTLIATGMVGVCEALLYAYKVGLDLESVIASVSTGAAGSWALTNYAPRMCKGSFDPGFFVEHFSKDMAIALAEARRMRLVMPGLALAHQLYLALESQGHGRKGIHSLILALAEVSRIKWPPSI